MVSLDSVQQAVDDLQLYLLVSEPWLVQTARLPLGEGGRLGVLRTAVPEDLLEGGLPGPELLLAQRAHWHGRGLLGRRVLGHRRPAFLGARWAGAGGEPTA